MRIPAIVVAAWCALAVCSCARRGPGAGPAPDGESAPGTAADRTFTNSIGMRFVLVPAGEFTMGSDTAEDKRNFDEGPAHRVRITKPFYLATTEVTQAQWKSVMEQNPSAFVGDDLPVEHVSWERAVEFVSKLSEKEHRTYQLPTEAQWEYAARAGSTTPFFTGATIADGQANFDGTYAYGPAAAGEFRGRTTSVASFPPNAWGLYDVAGNVHEWCADWYGAWYYGTSPTDDPPGGKKTSSVTPKILRGGSFEDPPWVCRSAARHRDFPGYGDDFYGLRLALAP